MASGLFNRVLLGIMDEKTANARAIVPGKINEVTRADGGERIVTFEPGIGRRVAGEQVADGLCPGRPVLSLGGGGWAVQFPLVPGDEAIGLAVDRNPERWEANRTLGQAHTLDRPHDVSSLHLLPFSMTAGGDAPPDPGADFVISNERGEVMRLGLGTLVITTPGPNPLNVATIDLTAGGNVEINVAIGKFVVLGDSAAKALTQVQALLTVLTNASNAGLAAALPPPAIDNGVALLTAFLGVLTTDLVSTAGTKRVTGA